MSQSPQAEHLANLLRYALAKQIPSAERSVQLHTDYGALTLTGEAALNIAGAVRTEVNVLLKMLEDHEPAEDGVDPNSGVNTTDLVEFVSMRLGEPDIPPARDEVKDPSAAPAEDSAPAGAQQPDTFAPPRYGK